MSGGFGFGWVIVAILILAVIFDASAEWGGLLLIILVLGMLGVGHSNGALAFPSN